MKKYYMSIIDFSEIRFLTNDLTERENAEEMLSKLKLITAKGNPSPTAISEVIDNEIRDFLDVLEARLSRRINGVAPVIETFDKMYAQNDISGMYLYLAFLYGFIGWRVPLEINLISAREDTLRVFLTEFMRVLRDTIPMRSEEAGNETE